LNKTNIGLLLIHQLSVENNLIDSTYSNKVTDMALKFDNVVGFISQEKVLNEFLTFTPRINLSTNIDNKGQTYRSIDQCQSDIFIVGRGIYESNDMIGSVINYKMSSYNQWIHKKL
jgi:hypothetical protein